MVSYPTKTITDYTDDLVLFTNTPTQVEYQLQAAGGIGFYVNANKTEYICFKQKGAISTLKQENLMDREKTR